MKIARYASRLLVSLFLIPLTSWASTPPSISSLLEAQTAPEGVVFEVLSSKNGLEWAIPQIIHYSEQLRTRFPGLPIAVVSHGSEQFFLQTANQKTQQAVHQGVQQLTLQQDIPVHVCGTHASWRGLTPEDFPSYVDVAPSGPVQIKAYQELGYTLILLERNP